MLHSTIMFSELIPKVVAEHYGVTVEGLKSKGRTKAISEPRRLAAYLLRDRTILTLDEIGDLFNRDHTTIIYALRTVEDEMKRNPSFAATVRNVQILVTRASLVSVNEQAGTWTERRYGQ